MLERLNAIRAADTLALEGRFQGAAAVLIKWIGFSFLVGSPGDGPSFVLI